MSWGGVLAQLTIVAIVFIIAATGIFDTEGYFGPVLTFLGLINLVLAAYNSLPSRGLDGAMMWRIVPIWWSVRRQAKTNRKKKRKRGKRSLYVVPKDE